MKTSFRFGIAALVATVVLAMTPESRADSFSVTVNPGPTGPVTSNFSVPLSGFGGTPVSGQAVSVDIRFSESKRIEVHNDSLQSPGLLLALQTTNIGPFISDGLLGTGYLLDATGSNFTGTMSLFGPSGTNDGGLLFASLYARAEMNQVNPLVGPYSFYGVHFDTTLPTMPGTTITSASLRVIGADSINVPEPTSLAFLATGLLAALILKVRRP